MLKQFRKEGAKRITRMTVFWSEPALQLCKLGWIQILHNNLLSWSLASWTELTPRVCVFVCECVHNFDDNKPQRTQASTPLRSGSLTWINQENFPINNAPLASGRVSRSAGARHAKDSYHSGWEMSCSASAWRSLKLSLRKREEEDDERHLRERKKKNQTM